MSVLANYYWYMLWSEMWLWSFGSGTVSGVTEVASEVHCVAGMLGDMVRVWL